jgi:lipopolysaccharide/colanic/teichoic acid biosynthesis glycosyltransferase
MSAQEDNRAADAPFRGFSTCMHGRALKRLFDLFAIIVTAPVWLPLLAFFAVLVLIKLGTPVFFRQKRPGHRGQIFEMVKFRTMTERRDAAGRLLPDAERLTPFGRWLRSTSLDELPELLNVLRGEMSLVGPRPLLVQYLERYTPGQARRHDVPPGLTGWCQVNGRNALNWDQKFALDVWYVDHRSFWLDLRILVLTTGHVLIRRGISATNCATMPEFRPQKQDEVRPKDGASSTPPEAG